MKQSLERLHKTADPSMKRTEHVTQDLKPSSSLRPVIPKTHKLTIKMFLSVLERCTSCPVQWTGYLGSSGPSIQSQACERSVQTQSPAPFRSQQPSPSAPTLASQSAQKGSFRVSATPLMNSVSRRTTSAVLMLSVLVRVSRLLVVQLCQR